MRSLSIGEVSRRTGVAASGLRYYERIGLLTAPKRVSGQRRYSEDVVTHVRAIQVAKQAGFSLGEIKTLVRGFPPGTPLSQRWRRMASAKIAELDALVERAGRMKRLLREGLACECLDARTCRLVTQGRGN